MHEKLNQLYSKTMTRRLIILISFLLVLSPVASAFSIQVDHGRMAQSSKMMLSEMDYTSACQQTAQDQVDESCCQDKQCNEHCQTMQCSNFGQLSTLSINGSIEPNFKTLSQIHARLFYEPASDPFNSPLRPPIASL